MAESEDNEKISSLPPETESSVQQQVDSIIGLGSFSARKSYYPELQLKIEELREEKNSGIRSISESQRLNRHSASPHRTT